MFLNAEKSNAAELLALFVDSLLQKKSRLSHDATVQTMDTAFFLFQYLNDKDRFGSFYHIHLTTRFFDIYFLSFKTSIRLLSYTSKSDDLETAMIMKLKTECGNAMVSKFEKMFADMNSSKQISKDFKAHLQKNPKVRLLKYSPKLVESCLSILRNRICSTCVNDG